MVIKEWTVKATLCFSKVKHQRIAYFKKAITKIPGPNVIYKAMPIGYFVTSAEEVKEGFLERGGPGVDTSPILSQVKVMHKERFWRETAENINNIKQGCERHLETAKFMPSHIKEKMEAECLEVQNAVVTETNNFVKNQLDYLNKATDESNRFIIEGATSIVNGYKDQGVETLGFVSRTNAWIEWRTKAIDHLAETVNNASFWLADNGERMSMYVNPDMFPPLF